MTLTASIVTSPHRSGIGDLWQAIGPSIAVTADVELAPERVTRETLLASAESRLRSYSSCAEPLAISNTLAALAFLVEDDGPTPQVGLDGERGIETEWYVGGSAVVLNCAADGTSVLWALRSDGAVPFRGTLNVKGMVASRVVDEARSCLEELAKGVRNRVSAAG